MPRRSPRQKAFGIRPHVFHMEADDLVEAIETQHTRLMRRVQPARLKRLAENPGLESAWPVLQRKLRNDLSFYFVALWRLFRVVDQASAEGYGTPALRTALRDFNTSAPGLRDVRDSAEHF